MDTIWTESGTYHQVEYQDETDLERAIVVVKNSLFGLNRIYLPTKKIIGKKGEMRNIPDGYLIDLSGQKPRLYIVENELERHDHLRHIAVQLLQFYISFQSEPRITKNIILDAINSQLHEKEVCERYAKHQFRNLDHMIESMVYESPFTVLVIVDDLSSDLENVRTSIFQFGVEVLEVIRFENNKGERFYRFEPFLTDISPSQTTEIDTIIVPAQKEGFERTFLRKNCWYAIRIHGSMIPQIKYIAAYQVAPMSAITHIAPVRSIEPWEDSGKYIVKFSEPAKAIGPIPLGKRIKTFRNTRYTSNQKLYAVESMDNLWPEEE